MDKLKKLQSQINRENKKLSLIGDEVLILQRQIDDKQQEAERIKSFIDGLNQAMSLFSADDEAETQTKANDLRKGSRLDQVRSTLREYKEPMYIDDILTIMGVEPTKQARHSLTGSINRLVRDGAHFAKTAPNTFTLIELLDSKPAEDKEDNRLRDRLNDIPDKLFRVK